MPVLYSSEKLTLFTKINQFSVFFTHESVVFISFKFDELLKRRHWNTRRKKWIKRKTNYKCVYIKYQPADPQFHGQTFNFLDFADRSQTFTGKIREQASVMRDDFHHVETIQQHKIWKFIKRTVNNNKRNLFLYNLDN